MNTKLNENNSKTGSSPRGWFMGGVLTIAAVAAITLAARSAPGKPAAEPPSAPLVAQNASMQSVAAYIAAHEGDSANAVQSVPDASAQGVAAYLAAHAGSSANAIQSVPDAGTQGILAYLQAHNGTNSGGQIVPEAATQGVLDYLRAHGVQ